jgi:hypothetical protein
VILWLHYLIEYNQYQMAAQLQRKMEPGEPQGPALVELLSLTLLLVSDHLVLTWIAAL